MKRFLTSGFILIFCSLMLPAFADDGDFWDEPMKIDSDAKNQKHSCINTRVLFFLIAKEYT